MADIYVKVLRLVKLHSSTHRTTTDAEPYIAASSAASF